MKQPRNKMRTNEITEIVRKFAVNTTNPLVLLKAPYNLRPETLGILLGVRPATVYKWKAKQKPTETIQILATHIKEKMDDSEYFLKKH